MSDSESDSEVHVRFNQTQHNDNCRDIRSPRPNLMDMEIVDDLSNSPVLAPSNSSLNRSTPRINVQRQIQNRFDDMMRQMDDMFDTARRETQAMTQRALDAIDRRLDAHATGFHPPTQWSTSSNTHGQSNTYQTQSLSGMSNAQAVQWSRATNVLPNGSANVGSSSNSAPNLNIQNSGQSQHAPNSSSQGSVPSQNTSSSGSGTVLKPQFYDGTEDFDDYLSQFDIISELNNWSYGAKSLYLAGCLKGDARALLSELPPIERRDYNSLVQRLNLRFGSVNRAEIFKATLQTRIKRRDESISELAQSIKKLTRQAYPNAASNLISTLARDYFIDALPDSDMRLRIRESQVTDISQAEILALRLEAYRVADRQKSHRFRGHEVREVSSEENDHSKFISNQDKMIKFLMDGFSQQMKSFTNDIKQVVKAGQSKASEKENKVDVRPNNQNNGFNSSSNNTNGYSNNRPQNQNWRHDNSRYNQNGQNRNFNSHQHNAGQGHSNGGQGNRYQSSTWGSARQNGPRPNPRSQ